MRPTNIIANKSAMNPSIAEVLRAIGTVNADRTEELGNRSDHSPRANGQAAWRRRFF
jgi:hypothetical protein